MIWVREKKQTHMENYVSGARPKGERREVGRGNA